MAQLQIRSRDNSLDIARGIAILGVLYGHAMAWQDIHGTVLAHWFWSYHMALFALVSGYFYKERPFWATFKSSVKSLLVPYFIVSFVLFFLNQWGVNDWNVFCYDFLSYACSTLTLRVNPPGFWFVIALFNCRLILAVISRIKYKYKYLFLAVLSLFIFFFPKHIEILHFSRTFGLMVFVIIGIYSKRYELLDRPVSMIVAVILAIMLLSAGLFFVDIWRYYMPLYVLNYLTASIISYALVFYCKQLDKLKTTFVNPFKNLLAFCGRHSMMILSFQAILGVRFIKGVNNYAHIQNAYVLMLIFVFGCIMSTFILNMVLVQYHKRINLNGDKYTK